MSTIGCGHQHAENEMVEEHEQHTHQKWTPVVVDRHHADHNAR